MISSALGPIHTTGSQYGVDPNKSGDEMGKDEFLQLLVAQLRNQDPMNPSNPEEFAAQLAQFTSVEQLININDTLAAQAVANQSMASALNQTAAMGALGQHVLAPGDRIVLDPTTDANVVLGVGGSGGAATLTLQDAEGETVATLDLGDIGPGRTSVSLKDFEAVQDLPDGEYTFEVTVVGEDNSAVEVQAFTLMRVDGVRYGPTGPVLLSGDMEIPLSDVVEIVSKESSNEGETPA